MFQIHCTPVLAVSENRDICSFTIEKAREARAFHRSLEAYAPTPLRRLHNLAARLGIRELLVKDESFRFGLNSFKALGGSFAMGRILQKEKAEDGQKRTFITTTDGNHGRGVAWAARVLGHEAYVFMPRGTVEERLENIRKEGAHAQITDMIYDDCVRYTAELAHKNDWILIQDTSWEGYEEIPKMIMQGYTTIGLEILEQMDKMGDIQPTHIFLQAGVGSMAGALTGFFAERYRKNKPVIVIVEPEGADCFYRTAKAADGQLHACRELHTIMAGLNCGEPCRLAWDIIERYADFVIAVPDQAAADGMRILGNPLPGDDRIISGESGAVTVGVAEELLRPANGHQDLQEQLGLGHDSVVLCISTEGDTDRENYRDIVWYGKLATESRSAEDPVRKQGIKK